MEEFSIGMVVVTLWETFRWLAVIGALAGLFALVVLWRSLWRARRRNLGAWRLFRRGVIVMLVVALILTPFVPTWTMAPIGDLRGIADYVVAFGMALAPAALAGVFWVYLGSLRTASRPARA
ncbi:hypothetical protein [Orrella marina]|uniref:Uncharacterized protein n=1 Tax=Orrella marina TaxID=2163011 RepID=A0A2R4XIE8_9BURK|nr:hypothetical protein [Orrella marina]AWB33533.1 hypothetical protein DBV39_07210 [Orrella marina]